MTKQIASTTLMTLLHLNYYNIMFLAFNRFQLFVFIREKGAASTSC